MTEPQLLDRGSVANVFVAVGESEPETATPAIPATAAGTTVRDELATTFQAESQHNSEPPNSATYFSEVASGFG
jgi:hypothetical protein